MAGGRVMRHLVFHGDHVETLVVEAELAALPRRDHAVVRPAQQDQLLQLGEVLLVRLVDVLRPVLVVEGRKKVVDLGTDKDRSFYD